MVVGESGAKDRIRDPLVVRMQLGEVAIVGECLFPELLVEIGVRDAKLCQGCVVAVRVVVDDVLECVDGALVVPRVDEPEVEATLLELGGAFRVELLGGRHFAELLGIGRAAGTRHGECQQENGYRLNERTHGDPPVSPRDRSETDPKRRFPTPGQATRTSKPVSICYGRGSQKLGEPGWPTIIPAS